MHSKSIGHAVRATLALGAAIGLAGPAFAAALNQPPPAGNVIYQLTGQTPDTSYQQATVSFVAGSADTNLAFAFRNDPAFINLSDVQLVDATAPGTNLVTNGNFDSVGVHNEPTGWAYLNFGASDGGSVSSSCGVTGSNSCYDDGAVGAYDAIDQAIATTIGDTYDLSFWYNCTGGCAVYQPLSTNGQYGNGQDLFVYAGATAPTVTASEPGSLALLGAGVLALFGFLRRRHKTLSSG